ncbi:hypothetical protein GOP47_0012165 [Adiantum capillus-veneris]|uniref:Uncharacterized protein n=1 Tax=Adiantum capillus-veneris TaxID=13818 RepID=A0A9D4UQP1_ADICA|nr:hypothetical protein GOP47_0012165 [Adiantum capillus-veneris]
MSLSFTLHSHFCSPALLSPTISCRRAPSLLKAKHVLPLLRTSFLAGAAPIFARICGRSRRKSCILSCSRLGLQQRCSATNSLKLVAFLVKWTAKSGAAWLGRDIKNHSSLNFVYGASLPRLHFASNTSSDIAQCHLLSEKKGSYDVPRSQFYKIPSTQTRMWDCWTCYNDCQNFCLLSTFANLSG